MDGDREVGRLAMIAQVRDRVRVLGTHTVRKCRSPKIRMRLWTTLRG
jgi:hypothetical protein